MTKFKELQSAYQSHQEEMDLYHKDCRSFGWKLTKRFADLLEVEHFGGKMKFFPPSEQFDPESQRNYNVRGGMELKEDSFYHIAFALILTENVIPEGILTYRLLLKKVNDAYILKNGHQGERTNIPAAEGEIQRVAIDEFCESLFEHTKMILGNRFQNFIRQNAESAQIGFDLNLENAT